MHKLALDIFVYVCRIYDKCPYAVTREGKIVAIVVERETGTMVAKCRSERKNTRRLVCEHDSLLYKTLTVGDSKFQKANVKNIYTRARSKDWSILSFVTFEVVVSGKKWTVQLYAP